jgi:hypothetical protein
MTQGLKLPKKYQRVFFLLGMFCLVILLIQILFFFFSGDIKFRINSIENFFENCLLNKCYKTSFFQKFFFWSMSIISILSFFVTFFGKYTFEPLGVWIQTGQTKQFRDINFFKIFEVVLTKVKSIGLVSHKEYFHSRKLHYYWNILLINIIFIIIAVIFQINEFAEFLGASLGSITLADPYYVLGIIAIYLIRKPKISLTLIVFYAVAYQYFMSQEINQSRDRLGLNRINTLDEWRIFTHFYGGVLLASFFGILEIICTKIVFYIKQENKYRGQRALLWSNRYKFEMLWDSLANNGYDANIATTLRSLQTKSDTILRHYKEGQILSPESLIQMQDIERKLDSILSKRFSKKA